MTFAEIAQEVSETFRDVVVRTYNGQERIDSLRLDFDPELVAEGHMLVLTGGFSAPPPVAGSALLCVSGHMPSALLDSYNLILVPSEALLTKVFNYIQSLLDRRGRLNRFLHESLLSTPGMQELTNRVAEFMGNPVVVSDINLRIVAMSDDQVDDSAWIRFRELGYLPYHTDIAASYNLFVDGVKRGNTVRIVDGKHRNGYMMQAALMSGNGMVGHVSVYSFYRDFTSQDTEDINAIAGLLAIKVLQNTRFSPEIQSAGEYFISELISGSLTDESEIEARLMFLEWTLRQYLYLLIIRWENRVPDMDQLDIHARTFKRILGDSRSAAIKDDLIMVFSSDDIVDSSSELFRQLEAELKRCSAKGIVSSELYSIKGLHIEYERAMTIFDINLKIGRREILQQTEMGVIELMFHTVGQKYGLMSFCHPLIRKLLKYDEDNGTELTKCLEAYICTGRSFGRAAERLFTHRNTVIYRIGKISELLSFDFQREETVMHFELSFCILNYIKCLEGKQKMGEK